MVIGEDSNEFYALLNSAKENNKQLADISKRLEDIELINNVNEIHKCSEKIINTIQKNPKKLKQAYNFLNYYLPVTTKILVKYDEIENQNLSTKESKKFMENTKNMMQKIKEAFEVQLSNLYHTEMQDTDAEIKVFETMLKTDGFTKIGDFEIKEDKK